MNSIFLCKLISLILLVDSIFVTVAENSTSDGYLRNQNIERHVQQWSGIRINCGSALTWTDPATMFEWIADNYYHGDSWTYTGSSCPTASVGVLSCKHRYFTGASGGLYKVPVPAPGEYSVRLHFSEVFFKSMGKRVFDVMVQDKLPAVVSKLDLFAVAGRHQRYSLTTTATVTTGTLFVNIKLLRVVENPIISGIEILPVSISQPVKAPASAPVKAPTSSPVKAPASVPVKAPTSPPVKVPAPVSSCKVPKLVGNWEPYSQYPIAIAEAQGYLVGDEMVLFSGFANSIVTLTPKVYSLDLKDPTNGKWVEQDPIPIKVGLTHASHAFDKSSGIMYVCGGYIGGHPGPATSSCLTYTHKNLPGMKWKPFPSLPGERAGGAMWHDSASGSLIVGAGASRPDPARPGYTIDHNDVFQIFLDNFSAGWKTTSNKFPYFTNHVGRTTVTVSNTGERHFAVGGQLSEDEFTHNRDDVYEMNISNKSNFTWTKRQVMPFARGHISESTLTWKDCGIIIIAGAVNATYRADSRTDDISYYDLATNSWSSIGKFTDAIATPICVIRDGYIYCQSGFVWKSHARRIKIQ